MSSPSSAFCSPSSAHRNPSQFTFKHLTQLSSSSTSCPLRVIAHIDLDAFYAQCEMIRKGIPEDKPLAVQQWQGLIAVNYPARAYGIGRMTNVTDAKKQCPSLIAQHVATWKEGDDKWAYHPDAAANISTHKVSLDPYRAESRKILAQIKDSLPHHLQKVEKASIDEVFLDLSAQVHAALLERFPDLREPPPGDDLTERLPRPPTCALDWRTDYLVDIDDAEAEVSDPDWDDVAMLVASEIVRGIRADIRARLGYTCSAGLGINKLLSKLGSAYKKPNQQTVIRSRAVHHFLSDFKFTKIRMLGGKLGDQVASVFGTEQLKDLLPHTVDQLKAKLGDEPGVWLHNTIRGIDHSEVNPRTQIKSMLSAKAFRPSLSSFEQAVKWLRIFVGDIFSRLVEEGVLENKRRPKTLSLHHLKESQNRSRQNPIPQGKPLSEQLLLDLAKGLLSQFVAEGNLWPCAHLSLSVSGFEDGVVGNMSIGSFLVKGEAAKALKKDASDFSPSSDPPLKKRRLESGGGSGGEVGGIQRFFSRHGVGIVAAPTTAVQYNGGETTLNEPGRLVAQEGCSNTSHTDATRVEDAEDGPIKSHVCSRCPESFDTTAELQSHQDWHFAKDLQDEERVNTTFARQSGPPRSTDQKEAGGSSKPGRGKKLEQGQSRLKFG